MVLREKVYMNASFAHFIFIRFSVPIGYIKEGITIDETWLKYRWEIFNRITLPSLKNQTNQNFRILIFFDKRSPQWLIDENEKTAKGYSKYIPFYVES
ncbi:MAG: putative rhamnosyl transferase, partial [Helicobacteraceae bacterium]|nr:putative rhamnosyl transferase [Helicobacteraceae bacterium]